MLIHDDSFEFGQGLGTKFLVQTFADCEAQRCQCLGGQGKKLRWSGHSGTSRDSNDAVMQVELVRNELEFAMVAFDLGKNM